MIPVFKKGWLGRQLTLIVTSPMGMRRGKKHNGVDFRAAVGTDIYCPIGGKVMRIRTQKDGAGLYLVVRFDVSASEFYTMYFMHLHSVHVAMGQDVKEGDLLGTTGGSPDDTPRCGVSTGPHLHFEIRKQGVTPVNPLHFLSETCILKTTGNVMWSGRTTPMQTSSLHSISEYMNREVTEMSDLNECERDVKTVKKVSGIQDRLAPGIWQIVKLVMDSSVANRQMYDSSISMQTGSLINFFNKVCQQPLVEFTGDTFGNQYYFMVRRPPYDKEGILRMQDLTCTVLNDSDIRSTDLNWKSDGIYSWYQIIPNMEYAGMNDLHLYIPAIFFPEYAAIWGSRDLVVQSQYVNYLQSGLANEEVNNTTVNGDNIIKNAVRDLKYIIECNAYAPFVRQGTIVLNGDRRIKKGTLILMPNKEQFYVDSVSNSYSVSESSTDRSTTLTVSHGMMYRHIEGVEMSNRKKASYFNIIDFGLKEGQTFDDYLNELEAKKEDKNKTIDWRGEISKWRVNIDVFSYFLKRSQILD